MNEEWRLITGLKRDNHEVSSLGRVRKKLVKGGYLYRVLTLDKEGYLRVSFRVGSGNKTISALIHHLVLSAFIGPRPLGLIRRHLDGNSQNNSLTNLCYSTHKENMVDRKRDGRPGPRGTKQHKNKLSESDVIQIKDLLKIGLSGSYVGHLYGVTESCVWGIKSGHSWSWLTKIKKAA
jgi:hypothetical protein